MVRGLYRERVGSRQSQSGRSGCLSFCRNCQPPTADYKGGIMRSILIILLLVPTTLFAQSAATGAAPARSHTPRRVGFG